MKEQKNISIRLVSIKYSGASIGDDVRVIIETLGNNVSFDRKIKKGTEIVFNEMVGQKLVDKTPKSLSVAITIVELDPIFNDVGVSNIKVPVEDSNASPKKSTYRISMKESRGRILPSGAMAFFDITLETHSQTSFQYLEEEGSGWVRIKRDDNVSDAPLAVDTKVKITNRTVTREYFTIQEGSLRGINASIAYKKDGSSYFTNTNPQTKSVEATYSISKKTFTLNDKVYQTKDYRLASWSKGLYDIELPDSPHSGGRHYLDVAPHARVWFRIGHTGDRYLHVGTNSLGCVTITEHARWEEIYRIVIKARKGDGVSAGRLRVID